MSKAKKGKKKQKYEKDSRRIQTGSRQREQVPVKSKERQLEVMPDRQLYQNRYHAMLYIFGLSLLLSITWGFVRWMWLLANPASAIGGLMCFFVTPLLLTGLHLYLCRHYIRAIHDSKEKFVWYILPVLSFLLFWSVGKYVEIRFYPYHPDAFYGRYMAITWQFILLTEATLLFLVYRSYYVIKEYEESVQAETTSSLFDMRKLSNYLIYGVVPAIMILMYLITIADDSNGIHDGRQLVKWGSLYFPLVLVDGEWWRLITYGFQHSGFMHLFSNLIAYLVCVFTLQKRHSGFQIFGIFMLSVFFSGVFVLIFSQYNTVGASGGVFGLMTFWALDALRADSKNDNKETEIDNKKKKQADKKSETNEELGIVLPMLGQNLLFSFIGNVSTSCHLGGFFAGIIIWLLFNLWPILTWLLTAIAVVLTSICLYHFSDELLEFHKGIIKSQKQESSVIQENPHFLCEQLRNRGETT